MSDTFSDYLEDALLDHVFGSVDYTPPTTLYFALFTAAPGDDGTGGTEVTGGSYARLAVTNNTTNFPGASGGTTSNGTDFTWTTASASWGTVTYVGVYDASSGGNFLGGAALAASKAVGSGDTFRILTGDLDISLD